MNSEYKQWLTDLKSKIRQSQIKAAVKVNTELLLLYWDLGKRISEKESVWGSKLIEQISKDLRIEFPDLKGFSRNNLFYTKKFYQFYSSKNLVQQVAGQLQSIEIKQDKLVQQLAKLLPDNYKSSLPSIEEIEKELEKMES